MWEYDHYIGYENSFTWSASTEERNEETYLIVEFIHPFPLKRHYLDTARGANLNEPKTYTYHIYLVSGWDVG